VDKKVSWNLLILAVVFCVSLIVSNIIAGKIFGVWGQTMTAAVIIFPVVYIIGDVVPECYGIKTARRVIWLGFAMNLFAVIFFMITLALPYPPFWEGQDAFHLVLAFTPRLLAASLVAYLAGTNINAMIMVWMKKKTDGKWLWSRTISSTIVGEAVDTTIFITLAFAWVFPWHVVVNMIFWQWAFKCIYEIVATPLTYAVIGWIKKREGILPTSKEA
jgi:hypothetical protein